MKNGDEAFEELLDKMRAAWRGAPAPERMRLPEVTPGALADVDAVAVIHGWMARVARLGEAALVLVKTGYDVETSALVRSMIEHAIALWWMEDQRGVALQALVRQRGAEYERLKHAQAEGWELDEEGREVLERAINIETDEETRNVDYLLATAHQASHYRLVGLYQGWLVETWSTHPSIASAKPYFIYDAHGGNIQLAWQPRDQGRRTLATVTVATLTALRAYDGMLPGQPLAEQLEDWEQQLQGLLRPAEQGDEG